MEEIISIEEAARLMGRDRSTIYRWIKRGKLTEYENGVGNKGLSKAEVLAKRIYRPSANGTKKEPGSDG